MNPRVRFIDFLGSRAEGMLSYRFHIISQEIRNGNIIVFRQHPLAKLSECGPVIVSDFFLKLAVLFFTCAILEKIKDKSSGNKINEIDIIVLPGLKHNRKR